MGITGRRESRIASTENTKASDLTLIAFQINYVFEGGEVEDLSFDDVCGIFEGKRLFTMLQDRSNKTFDFSAYDDDMKFRIQEELFDLASGFISRKSGKVGLKNQVFAC